MNRIGPKMLAALQIVADNPGCAKIVPARAIGPNGSLRFGYSTVDRCIGKGLISATITARGYQLLITAAGQAALS
jgi:hypothetical protein